MSCPAKLKPARHFLLKAKELERSKDAEHKLMGLYCALSFITKSLPMARKDKECGAFVGQVMDELEKKKQNLDEATKSLFQENKGSEPQFIKRFATTLFKRADDIDRAGKATKQTARTFHAASVFFQVLESYDCPEDIAEVSKLVKYAKYKTADILKALKAGKGPAPGPPGGMMQDEEGGGKQQQDSSNASDDNVPPSNTPSAPPPPSYEGKYNGDNNNFDSHQVDNSRHVVPPPPSAHIVTPTEPKKYDYSHPGIDRPNNLTRRTDYVHPDNITRGSSKDALECARYAVAALEEEDEQYAIHLLRNALKALNC